MTKELFGYPVRETELKWSTGIVYFSKPKFGKLLKVLSLSGKPNCTCEEECNCDQGTISSVRQY